MAAAKVEQRASRLFNAEMRRRARSPVRFGAYFNGRFGPLLGLLMLSAFMTLTFLISVSKLDRGFAVAVRMSDESYALNMSANRASYTDMYRRDDVLTFPLYTDDVDFNGTDLSYNDITTFLNATRGVGMNLSDDEAQPAKVRKGEIETRVDVNLTLPRNKENVNVKMPLPINTENAYVKEPLPRNNEYVNVKRSLPRNNQNVNVKVPLPINTENVNVKVPLPRKTKNLRVKLTMPRNFENVDVKLMLPRNRTLAGFNVTLTGDTNNVNVKVPPLIIRRRLTWRKKKVKRVRRGVNTVRRRETNIIRGGNDLYRGGNKVRRGENEVRRGDKNVIKGGNDVNIVGNEVRRGGNEVRRGGNEVRRGGNEVRRGGHEVHSGENETLIDINESLPSDTNDVYVKLPTPIIQNDILTALRNASNDVSMTSPYLHEDGKLLISNVGRDGNVVHRVGNEVNKGGNETVTDVTNDVNFTAVVLLTYMRSGSSLTGHILDQQRDTFYVFEPLVALFKWHKWRKRLTYMNGTIRYFKQYNIAQVSQEILTGWLTCNFALINKESLMNNAGFLAFGKKTKQFNACVTASGRAEFYANMTMQTKCIVLLHKLCMTSKFRIIKTIRTPMTIVRPLLETIPGSRVVHLIRDPRATVLSQKRRRKCPGLADGVAKCARILCSSQHADTIERARLQRSFGERILPIQYEDLVNFPSETTYTVYDFLNKSFTQAIDMYVRTLTLGAKPKGCAICQKAWQLKRQLPSERIDAWKTSLLANEIMVIQKLCKKVMPIYNYELYSVP